MGSTLGFEINGLEKGYYADKEDAFDMRKYFPKGLKKVEAEKAKKGKGGKDKKDDEAKKDDTKKEDEKKDDDNKDEEETATEAKDADGDEGKKKGKKKEGRQEVSAAPASSWRQHLHNVTVEKQISANRMYSTHAVVRLLNQRAARMCGPPRMTILLLFAVCVS